MEVFVPASQLNPVLTMPTPGGFMNASEVQSPGGIGDGILPESTPIITRGADPNEIARRREIVARMETEINRGTDSADMFGMIKQVGEAVTWLNRNLNTSTSYLPVRENLEGEVAILVPLDTPMRNRLVRHPGSGRASVWKQISALGGGWSGVPQPGGGGASIRSFFSETGAPADHTTTFTERTASYKLLGTYGSVTGLAAAQAANFANQLAGEKTRAIKNLMLNEEFALVNGDATSTAAPWGDGANALSFNGIIKSSTTANGVPTAQVQSAVGNLTLTFIDTMLRNMWDQGVTRPWIMAGSQELLSLVHLAESASSIIRMQASTSDGGVLLGLKVVGYVHPISTEIVPILPTRFIAPGTMVFGSDQTPDGHPVMDVDVLPQVQLPVLAPNTNVQGYVAQELAPTASAPQVYPFIVSVYETFRLKAPLYVGIGQGINAV